MAVVALAIEPFATEWSLPAILAEQLGCASFDHRKLELDLAERARFATDGRLSLVRGGDPSDRRWSISTADLAGLVRELILDKSQAGDAVIAGWCAASILQGIPDATTVLITAPRTYRALRLQHAFRYPLFETALLELASEDKSSARIAGGIFGPAWQGAEKFDLVMDAACTPLAHLTGLLETCLDQSRRFSGIASRP